MFATTVVLVGPTTGKRRTFPERVARSQWSGSPGGVTIIIGVSNGEIAAYTCVNDTLAPDAGLSGATHVVFDTRESKPYIDGTGPLSVDASPPASAPASTSTGEPVSGVVPASEDDAPDGCASSPPPHAAATPSVSPIARSGSALQALLARRGRCSGRRTPQP